MREVNVPDVPAAAAVIAGLAARYGGLVRAGATPASVAGVSRGGLIYLATPFTRRLPDVVARVFMAMPEARAWFLTEWGRR